MSNAVTLHIRGLGPVPSFKNNKMLARGKLITDPKKQEWMDRATHLLELQLRSMLPTSADAILTGCVARSWIASFMPLDDCRQWIPELTVKCVECSQGQEGANITIEPI